MAGAHYKVNQAANSVPTGTQDVARTDVYLSQPVHLVGDSSSGQVSPQFTILAWPAGSARLQPTNANTFDSTYTPDVVGSYLVEFTVNNGEGINAIHRIFAVTKDSGGRTVDDSVREPAFGETDSDDNSASNDRGYAKPYEKGLTYGMPTVASVAALRGMVASRFKHVRLAGYYAADDGGGGIFSWSASSTDSDDSGEVFTPTGLSTGRWLREIDKRACNVRHFGATGDAVIVTDATTTAASTQVTSATAAFKASDQGKIFSVESPSNAATGTVTTAIGNPHITGSGTAFLSEIVLNANAVGQAIVIEGVTYWVTAVNSDTDLTVQVPPGVAVSGKKLYLDTSITTTIATVTNATTIQMSVAAPTTTSGKTARFGTDDRAAILACYAAAVASGRRGVFFPPGSYGYSGGMLFSLPTNKHFFGEGRTESRLVDLRGSESREGPDPGLGVGACLTLVGANKVEVSNLGFQGNRIPQQQHFVFNRNAISTRSGANVHVHHCRVDDTENLHYVDDGNATGFDKVWTTDCEAYRTYLSVNYNTTNATNSKVVRVHSEDAASVHFEIGGDCEMVGLTTNQSFVADQAIQLLPGPNATVLRDFTASGKYRYAPVYFFLTSGATPKNVLLDGITVHGNHDYASDQHDNTYAGIAIDTRASFGPAPIEKLSITNTFVSDCGATGLMPGLAGIALTGPGISGEVLIDGNTVAPGASGLTQIGVRIGASVPVANKIKIGAHNHWEGVAFPVVATVAPAVNDYARATGSATDTLVRNPGGSVAITGTDRKATVTFDVPEDDDLYQIQLTAGAASAAPAAKALRAHYAALSTTGFEIHLHDAPGSGETVNVDWVVRRSRIANLAFSSARLTDDLVHRYNAEVGDVTKDGSDRISQIDDLIGTDHLVLATTNKALWVNNVLGSRDAARWDLTSTRYDTGGGITLGPCTVHVLIKATYGGPSYIWAHGDPTGTDGRAMRVDMIAEAAVSSTRQQRYAGLLPITSTGDVVWTVLTYWFDGTTIREYINGAEQPTFESIAGTPGTGTSSQTLSLGDLVSGGLHDFNGDFVEMLVYDVAQSQGNLKATALYLATLASLAPSAGNSVAYAAGAPSADRGNVVHVTGDHTVDPADEVVSIGTLSAPATMTLPASPADGETHVFKDANGSTIAQGVTIDGNGHNIDALSTFQLSADYEAVTVVYDATLTKWVVT